VGWGVPVPLPAVCGYSYVLRSYVSRSSMTKWQDGNRMDSDDRMTRRC
jgi:hypothetical protein